MKMFKVIFGLAISGLAFISFSANADTQVSCQWQFTGTVTAYPYGSPSELDSYACRDGQNRLVAQRSFGRTGYLAGTCNINAVLPFYYSGTCQEPIFWEPIKPKCSVEGQVYTRPTGPNLTSQMNFLCYMDQQSQCGFTVLSSNQSNVTFKCITK